ncbi:MAG: hypothetical protein ACW99G_21465 [Candidatus Thorarchaeota archaeon]|jgi:hypothetical protein
MEAIKTILSLIFKLTLIVVGLFLLFALAGYLRVEQNNKTAGNIVLCVAVGIIPLWFMRGLIWKFTKLTVFSILAIAGAGALIYGIGHVLPIAEMDLPSEDNVAMGLGFFVMIVVAIVAVKILSGIGSMFSGGGGGGGGGSYSAPSYSAPTQKLKNYSFIVKRHGRGNSPFVQKSFKASGLGEAKGMLEEYLMSLCGYENWQHEWYIDKTFTHNA